MCTTVWKTQTPTTTLKSYEWGVPTPHKQHTNIEGDEPRPKAALSNRTAGQGERRKEEKQHGRHNSCRQPPVQSKTFTLTKNSERPSIAARLYIQVGSKQVVWHWRITLGICRLYFTHREAVIRGILHHGVS